MDFTITGMDLKDAGFEISDLAAGVYFIQVKDGNQIHTKRFIKQ